MRLHPLVALAVIVTVISAASCKDDPPPAPAPPTAKAAPPPPPEPAPPPPGSDGDNKRLAALALAKAIDDALATFTHVEKPLAPSADGKAQSAEAWHTGKMPKKLVLKTKDATGAVVDTVDVYYDDRGKIGFSRSADGLLIFSQESLALWLDREQRVKRGVSPADARQRVEQLKASTEAALTTLGVR